MKPLKMCTISKYPPYMSGHSFEAIFQNKALIELTGEKHYELTYHPDMYDKTTNYNTSSELMDEAENCANVIRVKPNGTSNVKVFDGALIKAFIGEMINLISEKDVNAIYTYYLDPHGYIANEAKQYAKKVLGKDIVVVHKALGSDVLNSMANHLTDGEARFLLLEFLKGDILVAASIYTKDKLVEYARATLPSEIADRIERDTIVRYAPFDTGFFSQRNEQELNDFYNKFNINPNHKIISYFGRLFPEKGIEDLLTAFNTIKKKFPETTLLLGGSGMSMPKLQELAKNLGTPDVIFTGGVSNPEKRALMQISDFAVIPTKPIENFVETLCVCALEYQAAGTPLITTRVGGVPEAAGPHSMYVEHSNPNDIIEKVSLVLDGKVNLTEMREKGLKHIEQFDYITITKEFIDMINKKREEFSQEKSSNTTISMPAL